MNSRRPFFTDRIAVDRNLSSPYFGSVYVGWDHFYSNGLSASYLARCDGNLLFCVMLSGGFDQPVVSESDSFVAWTTPVRARMVMCMFLGATSVPSQPSAPLAAEYALLLQVGQDSAQSTISSVTWGDGTTLPTVTVVIGWATEQFRVDPGLISVAADLSPWSNNLYFVSQVCTSGHYVFSPRFVPFAEDNPGDCGKSAVILSKSTDGGSSWSSPTTLSAPAVNDQPFVTVD